MTVVRLSQLNWLTSGILATFLACLLTGCDGMSDAANSTGGPSAAVSPIPVSPPVQVPVTLTASRIDHVFVIVLKSKDYTQIFGSGSQVSYLASTLTSQGALLTQYCGTDHNSNDNYLIMISSQAPNAQTQVDCQYYTSWSGAMSPDINGQVTGTGCVYPAAINTIASQLDVKGLARCGHTEDMDNDPTCDGRSTRSHPALNGKDGTQSVVAMDGYATRHNPLMHFHSVIDNQSYCDSHMVRFDSLATDLNSAATTPVSSFIVPNLCNDGHDEPICADGKSTGGLPAVNQFLQAWVPQIINSSAFQSDGLLTITFDEAGTNDTSVCRGESTGSNSVAPGLTGPGGGHAGVVVLSPFVKPGMVSNTPYNHYVLLKSIEGVSGLSHLGYAGMSGLQGFDSDVYNATRRSFPRRRLDRHRAGQKGCGEMPSVAEGMRQAIRWGASAAPSAPPSRNAGKHRLAIARPPCMLAAIAATAESTSADTRWSRYICGQDMVLSHDVQISPVYVYAHPKSEPLPSTISIYIKQSLNC